MQRPRPVHVEGEVSPSLLANLELFMKIWAVWEPARYFAVTITADAERELPPVAEPGLAVTSFSCGVDSCFTTFRHTRGLVGRRTRRLGAGVLQHGFDVWLDRANSAGIYDGLLADAATMLASLGLPCIPMTTNFQKMRVDWGHAWGAQLASGLMLLARRFDTGLIANDLSYEWLEIARPSHPVTNVLLGSKGFSIIDDGGENTRAEKAKVISQWPEAMRHLRVCFGVDVPGSHENCCRCEKCLRTMVAFRVAGCPRPSAFKEDFTDQQIRRMRWHVDSPALWWRQLAREAAAAGLGSTDLAKAIRMALRRNRMRQLRNRLQQPFVPLRNAIRKLIRGTELSRSQRAAAEQDESPDQQPIKR
jgi:hypothetical protein